MQTLVFWPRAGAVGAGAILDLCAQLLWCELYGYAGCTTKKTSTRWPLHDIVIINIVWCVVCKGGSVGGRVLRDRRALVLQ